VLEKIFFGPGPKALTSVMARTYDSNLFLFSPCNPPQPWYNVPMKASEKHPSIEFALENIFGKDRVQCIKENVCTACGGHALTFKDDLSRKEYTISGFCQNCQDDFFETSEK